MAKYAIFTPKGRVVSAGPGDKMIFDTRQEAVEVAQAFPSRRGYYVGIYIEKDEWHPFGL